MLMVWYKLHLLHNTTINQKTTTTKTRILKTGENQLYQLSCDATACALPDWMIPRRDSFTHSAHISVSQVFFLLPHLWTMVPCQKFNLCHLSNDNKLFITILKNHVRNYRPNSTAIPLLLNVVQTHRDGKVASLTIVFA